MAEPIPTVPRTTAPPRAARNPWAVISLVSGLIAVLLCCSAESLRGFYFLLASIPAIYLGHLAKSRIAHSDGPMHGYLMAHFGLLTGYLTGVLLPLLMMLGAYLDRFTSKKAEMSSAINNCRQIIISLKLYSGDHNGNYPDAAVFGDPNSNEVFRQLFVEGAVNDEWIFGSPSSDLGKPDGKIGSPPDFREALRPGENHWAMVAGLTDSSPSSYPLVFENPSDASWPPKWNATPGRPIGSTKPGRTWSGGKVIIGMNDGSVTAQQLMSKEGQNIDLGPQSPHDMTGLNVFTQNKQALRILPPAQK